MYINTRSIRHQRHQERKRFLPTRRYKCITRMGKSVAATFQHRQVQEAAHWTKPCQAPVPYELNARPPDTTWRNKTRNIKRPRRMDRTWHLPNTVRNRPVKPIESLA